MDVHGWGRGVKAVFSIIPPPPPTKMKSLDVHDIDTNWLIGHLPYLSQGLLIKGKVPMDMKGALIIFSNSLDM